MEVLPGGKLLFLDDSSLLPWHTGDTQSALRRPASTLKTPSLSLFSHSAPHLTAFWTLRRDNVQKMLKQKPGRGHCAVLPQSYTLKGKTKELQLFPQCRFYCAGRFQSLHVMRSAVHHFPSRIKRCCLSSPPVREQDHQNNEELILEKQSRQIYEILLPFCFCAGNTEELITCV